MFFLLGFKCGPAEFQVWGHRFGVEWMRTACSPGGKPFTFSLIVIVGRAVLAMVSLSQRSRP